MFINIFRLNTYIYVFTYSTMATYYSPKPNIGTYSPIVCSQKFCQPGDVPLDINCRVFGIHYIYAPCNNNRGTYYYNPTTEA